MGIKAGFKCLVLGMGNPILGDDAVGLMIVRQVEKRFNHPFIIFKTTSLSGVLLLDLITGYDSLVIVDSIQRRGKPGELSWLKPEDFSPRNGGIRSQHKVGILQALQLGESLHQPVPEDVHILAVEAKDITTFCKKLTPEVEQAIPSAVEALLQFLDDKMLLVQSQASQTKTSSQYVR